MERGKSILSFTHCLHPAWPPGHTGFLCTLGVTTEMTRTGILLSVHLVSGESLGGTGASVLQPALNPESPRVLGSKAHPRPPQANWLENEIIITKLL